MHSGPIRPRGGCAGSAKDGWSSMGSTRPPTFKFDDSGAETETSTIASSMGCHRIVRFRKDWGVRGTTISSSPKTAMPRRGARYAGGARRSPGRLVFACHIEAYRDAGGDGARERDTTMSKLPANLRQDKTSLPGDRHGSRAGTRSVSAKIEPTAFPDAGIGRVLLQETASLLAKMHVLIPAAPIMPKDEFVAILIDPLLEEDGTMTGQINCWARGHRTVDWPRLALWVK